MTPYILLIDKDTDILNIHEMTVRSVYTGVVTAVQTGEAALSHILDHGLPRLIISDGHTLHAHLSDRSMQVPFILCSGNPLVEVQSTFSSVHIISKPNIVTPLIELLKHILEVKVPPAYLPIRVTQLSHLGRSDYDCYLRLAEDNFVKAVNRDAAFGQEDAQRYLQKSITRLYLSHADGIDFIKRFERFFEREHRSSLTASELLLTKEAIESVEEFSKVLGWPPECVEAAKKTVTIALKALRSEPSLFELLEMRLRESQTYSHHVSVLALMTAAFRNVMGRKNETEQMKLSLAAFLHDLSVEPTVYENLRSWNARARDPLDQRPETVSYRRHPIEAALLLQRMTNLPPDVDAIVLNHHENTTTSGYPRRIIAARITNLTALFIIIEDLMEWVEGKVLSPELIAEFVASRETQFSVGRFKNIFGELKGLLVL